MSQKDITSDIKKIMPSMESLLAAGVHFGHQVRRWHPKTKPFIYKTQNRIHIIDLAQTYEKLFAACLFLSQAAAEEKRIVFVGTKRQAASLIEREATIADCFYVNERWLGGFLTNFSVISQVLSKLNSLEADYNSGKFSYYTKLELLEVSREIKKLKRKVGGVRYLDRAPEVLVVVDPRRERTAVKEARATGVPVVALVDTNTDPNLVDYPIPSNDDAIRSIEILLMTLADSILLGKGKSVSEITALRKKAARLSEVPAPAPKEKEVKGREKTEKPVEAEKVATASGSLDDLGLSTRPYNALKKAGYTTLDKIRSLSEEELAGIKGMGAKSVKEVLDKLG